MGIKTLFIAPYRGLKELVTVLAKQQTDLDTIIEEADLSAAIPVVKAHEDNGVKFIISRGGTAKIIRQYTTIPVVEIKLSGYDILRTLTLIKDYKMKVHMIGFPNICNDVLSISNLLDINISYTVVHQKEEVADAVTEAWRNGAQLILGDTITVNTAEKFGLQGMLLTSGKEAVFDVFDQVRQMNQIMEQLENDYSLYKNFLNRMNGGIVIFQESGKIAYANPVFIEKLFKKDEDSTHLSIFSLPEEFLELIPELLQMTTISDVLHTTVVMHGESIDVSAGRLDHGKENLYYFVIHENNLVIKKGMEVHKNRMPRVSFAQLVTNSTSMKNVLTEAMVSSKEKEPLILWGEKGVGKKFLASSIHWESELRQGHFVELRFLTSTEEVTREILAFVESVEKTTLYVSGLEQLTFEQQGKVVGIFNGKEGIRVIYSFHFNPKENTHVLDSSVISLMNEHSIYLPTLKERMEDLEELVHLFVGMFNAQFGKQVVGIKEDALAYLSKIDLTENIRQLKDVVKELVNQSEGDYIDRDLIDSLPLGDVREQKESLIDLSKTLGEIERDVILHVLQEENMNQSQAAKRLGINRTTLWRKLK